MRAMLLAAGYGTRLGDTAREVPKPMLDVGGRPLIAWVIANLVRHGYDELAINLHHHGEQIRDYVGDGSGLGLRGVRYFEEPRLLGTAGGTLNAREYVAATGPFVVHYGDVVTEHDLSELMRHHRQRAGEATILVHERPGSNSVAVLAADGRVTRFLERPEPEERSGVDSSWAFSGVCVLEPRALARLPAEGPSDLPADLFGPLAADGTLHAVRLSGPRVAVDSFERLETLREAVVAGEFGAHTG